MIKLSMQLDSMAHYTGERCARFRNDILQISQKDFCNINKINVKNVSAFENGRANNIKYLFYYYKMCDSEQKQKRFSEYVFRGY